MDVLQLPAQNTLKPCKKFGTRDGHVTKAGPLRVIYWD